MHMYVDCFTNSATLLLLSHFCYISATTDRSKPYHLCLYHIADGLVEGVHLVGCQVADDGADVVQDLLDERHHLQRLNLGAHVHVYKM